MRRVRAGVRRSAGVLAVAALLSLVAAAGAGPAAGQQPEPRAPGVPPPVNPALTPRPATAAGMPFDHSIPGQQQVGTPTVGDAGCVQAGTLPEAVSTVENQPWGQLRLRLDELHRFATGRNQKIAVIDTGVAEHPRLAGRLDAGGDYLLGGPGFDDCDGHGTVVAGIIAASVDTTGATAFKGVAPDARILSIRQSSALLEARFLDQQQQREITKSPLGNTTSLAYAVVHAVERGATVINISEAACFPARADQVNGADLQAAVHYAAEKNVVVVAAAGNVGQGDCANPNSETQVNTVASPAWFDDDVLTVGAIAESGGPAEFTMAGPWVDVAAPGTDIISLDPVAGSTRLTNFTIDREGNQNRIQGTSFATPYVAGLAALIRERFPDLNARQVMERIERTALQPAGRDGHNNALGHGMIDPVAALTDVLPAEFGIQPQPQGQARLENLTPQPVRDPFPTKVALTGAGAGLLALAVTGFVVYTVQRARRRSEPLVR
jgi:membrane-anchored mycosin MYCP